MTPPPVRMDETPLHAMYFMDWPSDAWDEMHGKIEPIEDQDS